MEKHSAGAENSGKLPKLYALPGGTGLAARRHHRELDFCVVASVTNGTGLWGNRFV